MDSFEVDIRRILVRYAISDLGEESVLGESSYRRANGRREQDEDGESNSIVEYLDLQETYEILSRNRNSLPLELAEEVRSNTSHVNNLVPVRNRVMHGRPLATGDPEKAIAACRSFMSRYWLATIETLKHLTDDPAWEPAFELKAASSDRVLHNLPLPEYDETGLVGRAGQCQEILKHLKRRREPIVTIIGEGGIGKTAVALQVAYSLLDDPDSPFECILWVSLKTEKLTTGGVVGIADAVRDVAGAASRLGEGIISDFSGSVADLAALLEGVSALLIVDNLETISGAEIVSFYDELPDSISYLFTSRVGIGQFERRITLGPLSSRDATVLFRSSVRARGVARLTKLREESVDEIVSQLRFSPLAIRWYVLSVEAGREPARLLSSQEELLDFCVRTVYGRLGRSAQTLISVLYSLDRDTTFDELAVLVDSSVDELRRAVQDLFASSLAALEPDNENQLVSRVRLTEVAQAFMRRVNPPSNAAVEEILERERTLRQSEEERRSDEKLRLLAPNVVRVSSQHEQPVAYLLRLALLASKKNEMEKAAEYIGRARDLNAEYWEVDRVEAFMLSSAGRVEQSTALYRSALRKADGEGTAVVSYFLAGHLARKAQDLPEAIRFARAAHMYFNSAETGQLLGSFLVWSRDFAKGQEYLEASLEAARGRTRLITLTSLVNSWHRWAQHVYENDRDMLEAFRKASAGYVVGSQDMKNGTFDVKLADSILECCATAIVSLTNGSIEPTIYTRTVVEMLSFISSRQLVFEKANAWRYFPSHLRRLHQFRHATATMRRLCEKIQGREGVEVEFGPDDAVAVAGEPAQALSGRIRKWNGTYGFIETDVRPSGVFFPASAIINLRDRGENLDLAGRVVRFTIAESDDERGAPANWVHLVERRTVARE